jgi:adenylate kinase
MEFLDAYKSPLEAVISLKVSDDVIVDRLSNRRINKVTGESYHLTYHPPPPDVDPKLIIQRKDDAPESVLARLETYRRETHPAEMFFRQAGLLVGINGEGGVDDIFERVLGSVERFSELQVA